MQSKQSDASPERSLWGRFVDAVSGYDYFISYAWGDGREYAKCLKEKLREAGFQCFLDSDDFRAGDHWRKIGSWTLRRTSSLILVGSPEAVDSEPVLYEVETFQRFNKRVIPIDFEGTLDPRKSDSKLLKHLPEDIIRLEEPLKENLETGPSDHVVRRLQNDFKGIRQSQKRARLLTIAAAVFVAIVALASWMWAEQRRLGMVSIAEKLAVDAIEETKRLEHERAALLARQSYLINKSSRGDSIARIDRALRTVLGSATFNHRFSPDFSLIRSAEAPAIRAVAYSPDTDVVVLALWDAVGVGRLRDIPLKVTPMHSSLDRPAIAMSSDGGRLAITGSAEGVLLYEWNAPAWALHRKLTTGQATATCVVFAPDGKLLVAGTEDGVVFSWDLTRNAAEQRIGTYSTGGRIHAVAMSADAGSVATADDEGAVVLWNRATDKHRVLAKRSRSRSTHSVDFSPDGRWLAAASTLTAAVWIWDLRSLDKPPLEHQFSSPLSVAFTSDGRSLIVGNGLGRVHVWSTEHLDSPPSSVVAHDDEIRAISAVSTDGRFLTGSRDKTLRLWTPYSDVETAFRWPPRGAIVTAGGPTSRDNWVAYNLSSRSGVSRVDGKLQVHLNRSGRDQVIPLGVAGESAAFSPAGRFLAAGSTSEDLETGEETRTATVWDLAEPSTPISMEWSTSAAVATSGDLRAESLPSGSVQLLQKNEPPGSPALLEVPGSRLAPAVWFTTKGEYLLAKSNPNERFNVERTLHLQRSSTAALAGDVCAKVRRNLTRDEWQRFVGPQIDYERTCPNLP